MTTGLASTADRTRGAAFDKWRSYGAGANPRTLSLGQRMIDRCKKARDSAFYSLLRFRDVAAALEAFVATARLCSGVIVFSRALPPRRPISARYLEMSDLTIPANDSTEAG